MYPRGVLLSVPLGRFGSWGSLWYFLNNVNHYTTVISPTTHGSLPCRVTFANARKSFGGGAKQPLCSVKSVAGMHDLVVLLAAVPVHLFELAGGSIPSTTCGGMLSFLGGADNKK